MSTCGGIHLLCLVLVTVLLLPAVAADTCITCRRDTLEDCTDGSRAKEYDDQRQKCSDSLPFCEVTVQERLDDSDSDEEPQLRDVTRGCIAESRFTCTTESSVRTCTATCQGDLCNDFQDVARRVKQHQEEEEERLRREEEESAARQKWVIPVAVVVPLALLAAAAACVAQKVMSNRRKARDLKLSGGADRPLNAASAPPE